MRFSAAAAAAATEATSAELIRIKDDRDLMRRRRRRRGFALWRGNVSPPATKYMEELCPAIFPIKYRLWLFAGGADRPMIAVCDRVSATHHRSAPDMEYGIYYIGVGKRRWALSVAHRACRAKRVPRYPSCQWSSLGDRSIATARWLTDDESPVFLPSGVTSGEKQWEGVKLGKIIVVYYAE